MLKKFGSFLGWFSGSLAGISAFLYALGFVATMAEDRLLGIGFAFATRAPEFYIERGGSLVMRSVLIGIWPVLGLALLAVGFRRLARRLDPGPRSPLETAQRFARSCAPPAAALLMLAGTLYALWAIVMPALGVVELLFQPRTIERVCDGVDAISRAIVALDRDALNCWFNTFALYAGTVTGIGVISRSVLLSEGQGLWLGTAGVACFLTLVGLPLAYGILAAEKSAPAAVIQPPLNQVEDVRVRLLSRTEGGILVWLEDRPFVQWVSSRRIETLTVGRGEPIREIACPKDEGATQGE